MAEKRRRSKVSKTYSISDFDVDDTCEEKEGPPSVPKPVSTKSIIIRTVAGLSMVGFYLGLIRAGHVYCLLVSVSVQFECFRELVNLRYVEAKERAMPLFRTLQWMWFLIAITFVCKRVAMRHGLRLIVSLQMAKPFTNFSLTPPGFTS